MVKKTCTKCNKSKDIEMFYAKKAGLHSRSADCRMCRRAYQREYALKHIDEKKAYEKERYENNTEYFSDKFSKWYQENPGYMKEYRKRMKAETD